MNNLVAVGRILLASLLITLAAAAAAQQFPSRPIRMIIPYPPGGGTDPVARIVAQKLTDKWGQQVLVDNRAGGNTIIGTEAVAKSAPDGYTILLTAATFAILPNLVRLPYDTIKDLDPVATVANSPFVLALHPSVPANNLKELIAFAKARPGQLNYGSSATGGTPHLGTELLCMMTGIKMQHVPYKGSGPMTYDLVGGQIQVAFNNTISAMAPLIKNGKLKAIAVTSHHRLTDLPEVPTFAEAGLPGYELMTWFLIVAPAGTPKPIIQKMSSEVAALLAMPDTKEALDKQAMEPFISTSPDQVAAFIRNEIARFGKIIKAANIRLD